jgi:hypothetical protein
MTGLRRILPVILFALVAGNALATSKAWQDTVTLPTWVEGPPDIHPRIDALDPKPEPLDFHHGYYPYTTRLNFTSTREPQSWRRLNLENEYLACSFLPDLGGHLYTCIDKRNGRPIFRAESSVKKADVAPRGAWVAMGIEFNFPVAHGRDCVSPVSFVLRQEKDHAEIWLGDTDRVTGMQWISEFILRDGIAALEQHVILRNPTAVRHPFLWWANADLDLDSGTRFVYPAGVMGSHGFTNLDPWPHKSGEDLSRPFSVSHDMTYFAFGSREPFIAVYNANTRSAAVHVADPAVVTGKKLYHWGASSLKWARQNLSDANAEYVEMQAGLFTNQSIHEFLEPGQQIQFTELWMGGFGLNAVSRANEDAILSFDRVAGAGGTNLVAQLNVIHEIPNAQLAIFNGSNAVWSEKAALSPANPYEHSFSHPGKAAYRFELRDAAGKLLMSHIEGVYEAVPPETVRLGPQPAEGPGARRESPADFLAVGDSNERTSLYQFAESEYREGLKKFPHEPKLKKALGRLLTSRGRYAEAAPLLAEVAQTLPLDPELRYYQGIALESLGSEEEARKSWIIAAPDARFGPSALLEVARLEARARRFDQSLDFARQALERRPSLAGAAWARIALLRRAGREGEARQSLDRVRAVDPLSAFPRVEAVSLGAADEALWHDLAAEPERVLDLVDGYMSLGLYQDALALLARQYQAVPSNQAEPGASLPQANALVSYYRAYCRMKLGEDGAADFQSAASQALEYIFPHRASTQPVLAAALARNPNDASARFLTGLLALDQNRVAEAIPELQAALALRTDIPAIHYTLGRALLLFEPRRAEAAAVLEAGLSLHPSDPALKTLLAGAMKRPGAPPAATEAALSPVNTTLASPAETAAAALNLVAEGENGMGMFTARNFPQQTQPEEVRWAYIETQLQALRRAAARRDCGTAMPGVAAIGREDPALPFTHEGLDALVKSARVQYFLGAVESLCGQPASARSRWAKVAGLAPSLDTADFAFPAVAAQSLAVKGREADLASPLHRITEAIQAGEVSKAMLDYSKGILLLASGNEPAALGSFTEGAALPDRANSQYLNRAALAEARRASKRAGK